MSYIPYDLEAFYDIINQMELIIWIDAYGSSANTWRNFDGLNIAKCHIYSCGFLLKEDDDLITLCDCFSPKNLESSMSESFFGTLVIPKGSVQRRYRLKIGLPIYIGGNMDKETLFSTVIPREVKEIIDKISRQIGYQNDEETFGNIKLSVAEKILEECSEYIKNIKPTKTNQINTTDP
jgi:hypothetical protein